MASEVWKYFKIDQNDDKLARCNICEKLISRGGTSKTTSNLLKHLKTHKNKGKTLESSGLLNKPTSSAQSRPKPSVTSSSPVASTSTSTLHSFFTTKTETRPRPTLTLPGNSEEASDPDDPSWLTIEVDDNFDLGYRPRSISESDQSVNLSTPTSSVTSQNLSVLSPDSETARPTTFPSPYPKFIKLKEKKQITLEGVIDRVSKFSQNDERSKKISKLIAEMMCLDMQPFSIVENKGFLRLLNHLEPRYTIPSRKTFSNNILKDMYSQLTSEVKHELQEAKHVAITTDMWTSVAQNDFMAVTAHFYIEDSTTMALTHRCLDVVPFPVISHTGNNILKFLNSVFDAWEIREKIVGVVRDNGADITAALNRSVYEAFSCVAHTLQLVIKDGFLDNAKISNLIKKSRKLVGGFKHSAKNSKQLKKVQQQLGIPVHRMVQDEPTRWNSTFYMLKRLLEQKNAIILLSTQAEINLSTEMTTDDWRTMKFAVEFLEIYETATIQLSKESSTISEVRFVFCC